MDDRCGVASEGFTKQCLLEYGHEGLHKMGAIDIEFITDEAFPEQVEMFSEALHDR